MSANRANTRPPAGLGMGEAAAPLTLIAAITTGAAAVILSWVAAHAATPAGYAVPSLGTPMLTALREAARTASLDSLIGSSGSRLGFWLVLALLAGPLIIGVLGLGWWAASRAAGVGTPAASLARRKDYADMRGVGAAKRAVALRPSLAQAPIHPRDLGVRLGRLGRDDLYASEEDVTLTIAGPRSNKTSAMVVPAILSAPGPLLTTSNKVDSYTLTGALRAAVGEVFVLDPQAMTGVAQRWWWNPLKNIRDMADARRLVVHFVATVGGERADPYFTQATERLLCQLVVAAAAGGASVRDVRDWLCDRSRVPVTLLRAHNLHSVAAGLTGLLEAPEDQKGGVYETALTALSCLESEAVTRYVTPPATWTNPPENPDTISEFDLWRFVVGHTPDEHGNPIPADTLYALTQEGAGSAAPVVAALVDALLYVTSQAATAQGGRVDPPVRAVLDEAANICPIKNLPDLYSYFGSKSIQVMTFLQSPAQGVALWGKTGMDKLWSAATVKTIGAGAHDDAFCEQVSRLLGEHDVPTWSDQRGRGGGSTTRSYRRERILAPNAIANLTKGEAVLICTGRISGKITLLPWYREPDADLIANHGAQATAELRRASITALGEDNALAQVLLRGLDTDKAGEPDGPAGQ